MFYIEKTRESTEKLLELLREFSKVRGDKLNTKKKKKNVFLYTSNKQLEKNSTMYNSAKSMKFLAKI